MSFVSGPHRAYKRGDGVAHTNERRLGFGDFVDYVVPLVVIGLLGWLCVATMTLQQQVAVLLDRSTNQNIQVGKNTNDIQGIRVSFAELQRQVDDVKSKK